MRLAPQATLAASVKEGDALRREFYSAEWEDLILRTQGEDRCSLTEVNDARRETYEKKQRFSYLVQRGPDRRLRLGVLGQELREYHLPLPIFTPALIGPAAAAEEEVSPPERARSPAGLCPDKREIASITSELPPLMRPAILAGKKPEPARRSLSRSMSQEAQRG